MKNVLKTFLILALLSACSSPVFQDAPKGTLTVTIPGDNGRATVFPAFISRITHYKGILSMSGQTTLNQVVLVNSPTMSFTDLAVGTWSLTVEAYEGDPAAAGVLIGGAPAVTVSVSLGANTPVNVNVGPLSSGAGTLNINVTWPSGKADAVIFKVFANFSDYLAGTPTLLTTPITQTGTTGTNLNLGTIPAGQYVISVQPKLTTDTLPVTFVEAVYVFGNLDTVWNLVATTDDFLGTLTAPTAATVTPGNRGNITLGWTDNSNLETGYQVEYKETVSGTWIVLGSPTAPGATSQVVSGLKESTSYDFKVYAVNSQYSNTSGVLAASGSTLEFIQWVDDSVAVTGDSTLVAPYKTIGEALAVALPGDTIRIKEGTYNEILTVDGLASHGGNLTLAGGYSQTDWTVQNMELYPTLIESGSAGALGVIQIDKVNGANLLTLSGLQIKNTEGAGDRTVIKSINSELLLDNSYLVTGSDNGTGRALMLDGNGVTVRTTTISNTLIRSGWDQNAAAGPNSFAIDLGANFRGTLNLTNNQIQAGKASAMAGGLRIAVTPATVNLTGNSFALGDVSTPGNGSYGVYSEGGATLTLDTNSFEVKGNASPGLGVYLAPTGSHPAPVISNNTFSFPSTTSESVGIHVDGTITGTTIISGNRIIIDQRANQSSVGIRIQSGTNRVINNLIVSKGNDIGGTTTLIQLLKGTFDPAAEIWNNSLVVTGASAGTLHYIDTTATAALNITNNLFENSSGIPEGIGIRCNGVTDNRPNLLRNNNFHGLFNFLTSLTPEKAVGTMATVNMPTETTRAGTGTASLNQSANPRLAQSGSISDNLSYSDYSPVGLYTGGFNLTANVVTDIEGINRTDPVSIGAFEREDALYGEGLLAEWLFEDNGMTTRIDTAGNGGPHDLNRTGAFFQASFARMDKTGYASANYGSYGGLYNQTLIPNLTGKGFTVTLWIGELDTTMVTDATGNPLVYNLQPGYLDGFGLFYVNTTGTNPEFKVYTGYSGGLQTALTLDLTTVTLRRWNNIALVFSGLTANSPVILYLNGVDTDPTPVTPATVLQTFNWWSGNSDVDPLPDGIGLGVNPINWSQLLTVNLDDVRIFESALSAAKVNALMLEGDFVYDVIAPGALTITGYRPATVSGTKTIYLEWNRFAYSEPLWHIEVDWDGSAGPLPPETINLESSTTAYYATNYPLTLPAVGINHTISVTAVDKNGNRAITQDLTAAVTDATSPAIQVTYNDPTAYTYYINVVDQNNLTPTMIYDKTTNTDNWIFTVNQGGGTSTLPTAGSGLIKWYLDGVYQPLVGDAPSATFVTGTLAALTPGVHGVTVRFKNTQNNLYYSQQSLFTVVEN